MPPYYPHEADGPATRWRRCPECGRKAPGVRKDQKTTLTQCDRCWFGTDPKQYGCPEGK